MIQTLYVAMIADRHADPEAYLFTTAEKAIEYARAKATEYALALDNVEESHVQGWLYHASYSPEGDAVWVVEKQVDVA